MKIDVNFCLKNKVKDESKRAALSIKNIDSARSSFLSDSDDSVRIPRRKKTKTGVLCSNRPPRISHDRHHGVQCYCAICNNSGIPERK